MSKYFTLPYFELQKAIFGKLSMCEELTKYTRKDEDDAGISDAVDENTPYPYVTISEPYSSPFDTKLSNIETFTFTIHCWWKDNDEYRGKRVVYEMLSACQQALHSPYAINGGRVVEIKRMGTHVFDDNSPNVKHGVLTMQYKIQNI